MILTKKQLSFIETYVACVDSKTKLGNKLFIRVKDKVVTFSQFASNVKLFTQFNTSSNDNFEMLISTSIFKTFLNTVREDQEIQFSKDGISLGEESTYTFENFSIEFPNVDMFYQYFKEDPTEIIGMVDVKNLSLATKYCGVNDIEVIGLMDNSFVSSDRLETIIIGTKNKTSKTGENGIFYIPKEIANLLYKTEQIKIEEHRNRNFWLFSIGNTYCVIEYKRYALPYFFSEKMKSVYDHKYKIIFDKKTLLESLKRMSIFSVDNPSTRIHLVFDRDNFRIENRDFNRSNERIEYKYCDSEILGKYAIISCSGLLKAVSSLQGEEAHVFISEDERNNRTIKIQDEIKDGDNNPKIQIIMVQIKLSQDTK